MSNAFIRECEYFICGDPYMCVCAFACKVCLSVCMHALHFI